MSVTAEVTVDAAGSEADDAAPVLSVENLRAEFPSAEGTVAAVRDVSLTIRRREKLAIVGESGCGKSTLALAVLGLLDPPGRVAAGTVILNGRVISGLGDRAMSRVRGGEMSFIFQDPMAALDPVKTIGAQLVDTILRHRPGFGHAAARKRAIDLLTEVEVPAAAARLGDYPHQYSGGMRQRVMIAIALANDPSLVIADEPTTALDVTTQAQVMDILDRVVAEHGAAVMLITHNLGVVAQFCDRVNVMYAGRIVERGTVAEVFARPLHPYTEALIRSVPRPGLRNGSRLPAIPGMPPDLAHLPAGCSFEPRCEFGNGREICRRAAPLPHLVEGEAGRMAECHFVSERLALEAP